MRGSQQHIQHEECIVELGSHARPNGVGRKSGLTQRPTRNLMPRVEHFLTSPQNSRAQGTDAKKTKELSRRTATALQWTSIVFGLVAEACLCCIGLWSEIPSDLIRYTMQSPTLSVDRAADRRRDDNCYAPIQAYARCCCQPLEAPSFVVCRLPHHGVKKQQD